MYRAKPSAAGTASDPRGGAAANHAPRLRGRLSDALLLICAVFAGLLLIAQPAAAVERIRKNNTQNLNKGGSWSGGVPGAGDVAVWDSTVTSANASAIGGNLSWQGIRIANPGGAVTIDATSGRTLTLGTAGINMSAATQDLTLNCALMLGSSQIWDVTTGRIIAASGVIGGSGGLTKNSLGILSLTGVNTFTGGVTIGGGVVQINNAAGLGASSGTATINAGTLELLGGLSISTVRAFQLGNAASTFQIDNGSSFTISGAISNAATAGSLVKTGAGTLILSAAAGNTYGGAGQTTSINGGTLQVSADNLLGNSANTVTFNGGTLMLLADFSSARNVSMAGAGTVDSNNNFLVLSGVISGSGALTKTGAGTLTLSGSNTYSGGTTISGGSTSIISIASSANLGTGAVTLSSGSGLATTAGMVFGNGLVLGASGGTAQGDGNTVSGMVNVGSGTTMILNGAGITETTSGTGRLEKLGAGTLVLSTANTFSGGTYVHDGTLVIANSSALGPQPTTSVPNTFTIDNGARLAQLASAASRRDILLGTGGGTLAAVSSTDFTTPNQNVIAYRSGVVANVPGQASGGIIDSGVNGFGGANTFTGSVVVNSGATLAISRDVNLGAAANQLFLNGATLRIEDGVDITTNGGTTATSVLATFSTSRQISLGAGSSTIEVKNYADTNNSFDVSPTNPIVPSGGRPTSHLNTFTINGAVSGAGALVKAGDGTLVLSNAANSYTGGTTINAGILSIADPAALGSATSGLTINPTGTLLATASFTTSRLVTLGGTGGSSSGGTFDVNSGVVETRTGVISGTGSLTKTGSGTLTLSATNTYTGDTYINGGTVTNVSNQAFGPQPTLGSSLYGVHLANGTTWQSLVSSIGGNRQTELVSGTATLDIGAGYSNQRNGLIYGAGGLIKAGGGTQILTNANTYSGGTTVNAGTLQVNNATGSGTGTGAVAVNSGGILSGLPTANGFTNAGTISGTVTVNSGGQILARSGGTFTFGGLALNASSTLVFQLAAPTATPAITLTLNNGLTLGGLATINISNFGNGLALGTYRLIDYTGSSLANLNNLTLGSTAGGAFTYSLSNNQTNSSVDLIVSTSSTQWTNDALGNWSTTNNWSNNAAPNASGAPANFLTAINSARTVTVDGAFTVGTLTFSNANSYTIATDNVAGHGLTLSNNGAAYVSITAGNHTLSASLALTDNVDISAATGTSLTISGAISQNSAGRTLIASGPGIVTLSGATANTYTGLTQVAAGTLTLAKTAGVNAIGTGGVLIDSGATLSLGASEQIADLATVQANGTFALGTSSETIAGLNGTGSVVLGSGSTLTIGAANNLSSQFDGIISGAGTITKTGTGTLALNGANTFGGVGQTVTLQNGNLQVFADNNLGNAANSITFSGGTQLFWGGFNSARAVVLASSGTFNTNNNSPTLSGVISGAGALTKAGAGTLTLSGTNTYTGGTMVGGGNSSIIAVASASSLGSGAVTISGGSGLTTTADTTLTSGIVLGATGGGSQADGNPVSAMLNVATGTTLTLSSGAISEMTANGGRLEKLGGGTLYVNTANSYSGGTYLHDGTLVFANALALGPQPLDNPTQNALTIDNGAHLVLTVGGAFKRNVYIGNGGAGFGATSSSIVAFRNGVFSNVTAQSGGVTSESGTNGFGGANTFSGAVTVNNGSAISISRDVNLGAAANQLNFAGGSTLKIEDGVDIVANSSVQATFSSSRTVNLMGGQATIEVNNTNNAMNPLPTALAAHMNILTLNGVVTGSGALVKSGAGTLVLGNAANTYTGGTTINGGTLSAADASALGSNSSRLTINPTGVFQSTGTRSTSRLVTLGGTGGASSGGTFDVTLTNNVTRTGVVDGTGSLTKTGTGTLGLFGANTYSGGTYINAGTIAINSSSSLGAAGGSATIGNATLEVMNDITSNRDFNLSHANSTMQVDTGTYALSGILSGAGTLNKTGDGDLTLSGANTYTGGTAINGGAVVVNSATSLGNGGPLSINAGTLRVATGYSTARNITIGNVASTIVVDPAQTYTLSGTVSGGGTLNKAGTGTLLLTGANSFTGETIVDDGTLKLAAASGNALASTSAITVNGGGTLLLGASNQIPNAAPVNLGGGTLSKGDFSEGAANSAGMGALTLNATGSIIDFGTGTVGILSFASFSPGLDLDKLTITNWTGTANALGTAGTDRLIFATSQAANVSYFNFSGYGDGSATQLQIGTTGFYEVVPLTAVPEPSTYLAALLTVGAAAFQQRRRFRRLFR